MTDTPQSVPDLVAAAKTTAKPLEDSIAADAESEAVAALEATAVDVLSAFEARMQHHFKRGPFSRKLNAVLLEAGKHDLAKRMHQYYLAINVLKHGKGASHRELLQSPSALFDVRPYDETDEDASLVDITGAGFIDGLTAAILEAYAVLEAR